MSYIDVYYARVNYLGSTKAERAQNAAIRAFDKRLAEERHAVELSAERGLFFKGIVLQSKEDPSKKVMELEVAVNIPLLVGDIVNWREGTNSELEKWIVFQRAVLVNEGYQKFYIVRCNYFIKWVDAKGFLQSSWCYLVSSMDSKIKGNFRTWNNLITPQPNKYLEIMIPETKVDKGTRFIVNEEGWLMVEYDNSSVPGIRYMSLTEEKVNYINDDRENDIADTDRLAVFSIALPDQTQTFQVGEQIAPIFTVMKNGLICADMEVEFESLDKKIAKNVNGVLTAIAPGDVDIKIKLKQKPEISSTIPLSIGNTTTFAAYIDGKDVIKLNRVGVYEFKANASVIGKVNFSINCESGLATIVETTETSCTIKANQNDKLGSILLMAEYNGKIYEKLINIIPIW